MPTCNSCNAKVLRTDAFCGTCGEPVPGAKPVVPIARPSRPSGLHAAPERVSGTFPPHSGSGASAQAAAVVALSEPEQGEPPRTALTQTAIREREASEPAPVLPLHRRKDGSQSVREIQPQDEPAESVPEEAPAEDSRVSLPQGEASLPNMPVPAGPPILASDLLREQMRPASPGAKTLRIVTVVLSVLGLIGAFAAGGAQPLAFISAALLVAMATLALTPMSYRVRAVSLTLVGAGAAGVALWQQIVHGVAPEDIILAGATILLSGSLLFRAYYRGARFSRFAVALGVAVLAVWFVASEGHETLVMLEGHWQSWAPAVTHMSFGLLGLLSLMAFMESSTRGGAHVWAVALLVVYAAHVGLLIASALWPAGGAEPTLGGPTVAALITGIVGTLVAGLALAQVFVSVYQSGRSRAKREA